MDRRIATTLTYGVRIDTNNLSRGVSKLDIEMLYRMFDECDYEVIHMLENSNLCFDDLMAYSSAISSIEVYDDISFCKYIRFHACFKRSVIFRRVFEKVRWNQTFRAQ